MFTDREIPLIFVLAFALTTLGVVLAAGIKSMQGFQAVINFLMMPIFFLAGALFPLSGLPAWMTVLTRLDPASYGVDPLRRTVLGAAGVGYSKLDRQLGGLFFAAHAAHGNGTRLRSIAANRTRNRVDRDGSRIF